VNPKGLAATLPIATIQFPAEDITGYSIVTWSLILSIFSFGAPSGYSIIGMILGENIYLSLIGFN